MLLQPNQLMGMPVAAARKIEQHVKDFPEAAVTTARALISAEERLRQRIGSALRVTLATLFFLVSGLISLGANAAAAAASALAKKVSPQSQLQEKSHRAKRTNSHLRVKLHVRHSDKALLHSKVSHLQQHHEHGIASWYGNEFNHRRTASGVRFDTHAMMAAHRTLPFGSKVRVTNLLNHKSCIVEITDRGPFKAGRIIDVSHAAAQKLDMAQTGTARVEIELLANETIFRDIASESYEDASFERNRPVFDNIPSTRQRTLDSILLKATQDQASR